MNQKEQIIAELLENESFLKWLSGKGNATDNQFWQNWISENTLHEEAFREISETWSVLTFKPIFSDETDAEWQKLSNRLNLGNGASPARALFVSAVVGLLGAEERLVAIAHAEQLTVHGLPTERT